MTKKSGLRVLILFGFTLTVYLPLFIRPDILLERGNDLQEQFWPIFYFIRNQILQNHTLPLWNNLFLSGLPLLPDPQFSFFYPPNLIFLILPISQGFLLSFFLHTLAGGVGLYYAARKGLNLTKVSSLLVACLYIGSPRLAGYLEAGHFGLVANLAWFPWLMLAVIMTIKTPKFLWSALLGISLAGLFYTHAVTFLIALIMTSILFSLTVILTIPSKQWWKIAKFFVLGNVIAFGLSAVILLPQIEWTPATTRLLLLTDRDVYPKWFSLKEFIQAPFLFSLHPLQTIWNTDTEKWLILSFSSVIMACISFLKLSKRYRLIIIIMAFITFLVAANNSSPLYRFLISQDWYVLMRVSTRIWFLPLLTVFLLAGFGFDFLISKKIPRTLLIAIALFMIMESLLLFWTRIAKPVIPDARFAPSGVYEFLQRDPEKFRVFCLTRCLSQQQSAKAGLELIEGYNTMQQTNYLQQAWQLTGGYWNYYSLALPPVGLYKFDKLKPDPQALGQYNTKYIISPFKLENNSFGLEKQINNYYIYKNNLFKPRTYFLNENPNLKSAAEITIFTPNYIRVDIHTSSKPHLILAEVYSKGWRAYLNGKDEVKVQETPNALRQVDIKPDTKFIDFKYQPSSYNLGKFITAGTILFLIGLLLKHIYIHYYMSRQ